MTRMVHCVKLGREAEGVEWHGDLLLSCPSRNGIRRRAPVGGGKREVLRKREARVLRQDGEGRTAQALLGDQRIATGAIRLGARPGDGTPPGGRLSLRYSDWAEDRVLGERRIISNRMATRPGAGASWAL